MPSILVADDEDGIRQFLRRVLESAGYEVSEASNGREAMAQVRQRTFDLAIIDLVMPEQEGLGAVEGVEGAGDVEAELGTAEALQGAAHGFLGTLHVDFIGVFSGVGEDAGAVGEHFDYAAAHHHLAAAAVGEVAEYAGPQLGDEGGVFGAHAELAGPGGDLRFADLLADEQALRGGDLERE